VTLLAACCFPGSLQAFPVRAHGEFSKKTRETSISAQIQAVESGRKSANSL